MIYSHSHADHFGGVKGVISEADVAAGKVQVLAPAGFMEAVAGEIVMAGTAMGRRAQYQFGAISAARPARPGRYRLGKRRRPEPIDLIAPTDAIDKTTRRASSTAWRSSSSWRRTPRRRPRC